MNTRRIFAMPNFELQEEFLHPLEIFEKSLFEFHRATAKEKALDLFPSEWEYVYKGNSDIKYKSANQTVIHEDSQSHIDKESHPLCSSVNCERVKKENSITTISRQSTHILNDSNQGKDVNETHDDSDNDKKCTESRTQSPCNCDICRRLYSGACSLLNFEQETRSIVSVETETKISESFRKMEDVPMKQSNLLISSSDDEITCEICGEDLVNDLEKYGHAREKATSSDGIDFDRTQKLCVKCLLGKVFTSGDGLTSVLDDVTPGIEYECAVCFAVFQSRDEIQNHIETHDRLQNHVCPFCEKRFVNGKEFYSHFRAHEIKSEFTCRSCNKTFSSEDVYQDHVKTHGFATGSETHKQIMCNSEIAKERSCSEATSDHANDSSLDAVCGGDGGEKKVCGSEFYGSETKNSSACTFFECSACECVFKNEREQRIHLKTHKNKTINGNTHAVSGSPKTDKEVKTGKRNNAIKNDGKAEDKINDKDVNIFQKKFNIDRSKKLKIRKRLVISQDILTSVTPKRKTAGTDIKGVIDDSCTSKRRKFDSTRSHKMTKISCSDNDKMLISKFLVGKEISENAQIKIDRQLQFHHLLPQIKVLRLPEHVIKEYIRIENGSRKTVETGAKSQLNTHINEPLPRTKNRKKLDVKESSFSIETQRQLSPGHQVLPAAEDNILLHSESNSLSNKDVESAKRFKCTYCPRIFKHESNLKQHTALHEGSGRLVCDVCSRQCDSKSDLVKHLSVHTGDRPYCCSFCGKTFTQVNNLNRHTLIHSNNRAEDGKSFSCDFCGKKFLQKCHMKRHRRIHTGEKPYKCDVCGEGFQVGHHLKRHMEKHEKGKFMKCPACDEKFLGGLNFGRHVRTHEGYSEYRLYTCKLCDKGFDARSDVKNHMYLHTDERPYNCDVCKKGFKHRTELTSHNKGIKHKRTLLKLKMLIKRKDEIDTSNMNRTVNDGEEEDPTPSH